MSTRRSTAVKLLDVVIGQQPSLAKIADGIGRVATKGAHPDCTCWPRSAFDERGRRVACTQHEGIRDGARYVKVVADLGTVERFELAS